MNRWSDATSAVLRMLFWTAAVKQELSRGQSSGLSSRAKSSRRNQRNQAEGPSNCKTVLQRVVIGFFSAASSKHGLKTLLTARKTLAGREFTGGLFKSH